MKKTGLLIILLVLTAQAFAQDKPKAVKFDSYVERQRDFDSIISKTEQFLLKLSTEPKTTRGIIVFYPRQEWEGDCLDGRIKGDGEVESFVRKVVSVDTTFPSDKVGFLTGNIISRNQVEFWVIPLGAESPSTYIDYDPPCCCPPLLIVGKPVVKAETPTIKFFAWMGESKSLSAAKYKWTVSAGKIVAGQSTSQIEVDVRNVNETALTVNVEIEGLSPLCNCPTSTSYTTRIDRGR